MSRTSPGAPIAVLGAGAWGTVLAHLLARAGARVRLWARRPEHAEALRRERENADYLPGLPLADGIDPTAALDAALAGAEFAVVAVPSRQLRPLLAATAAPLPPLLLAAKGIEAERFLRLSQVVQEVRPGTPVAVLSGPNLAAEIAAGKPAAATVASSDAALARRVQAALAAPPFRVYTSTDVVGVELAGAFKNVIALAAGMSDGLGLGDNTKAVLVTRGLAELVRLGTALGGDLRTFYGLAGLGDLVATSASAQSRNHLAGERFARGATRAEVEGSGLTAEGIPTALAVHRKTLETGLDLPISSEVYRVVFEGKAPDAAIRDLMGREAGAE